jgi:putative ABC transport system permease protein
VKVKDQVSMARRNLQRHKGRTRLTLLSIIIGAFAVISVIILSFTANQAVAAYFEETGEQFSIEVQRVGSDTTIDDALVSKVSELSGIQSSTPVISMYEFKSLRVGDRFANAVGGVSLTAENSNGTRDHVVVAGRELTDSDVGAEALVSSDIAAELTGANPEALVGETVYLVADSFYRGPAQSPDNCDFGDGTTEPECAEVEVPVTVVGVVQAELSVYFPLQFGLDQKQYAYFYYSPECDPDSQSWSGRDEAFAPPPQCDGDYFVEEVDLVDLQGYDALKIRVVSDEVIDSVSAALEADFGMRNRINTQGVGDLEFAVGRDTLREIQDVVTLVTLIFLLVGGISLLVSSIGVVNTMTMSALERTREIGVMRALGASRKDVTRVFTVESALIGFLGGLWGLILAGIAVVAIFFLNDGLATLDVGFTLGLPLLLTALIPASLVVVLTTVIGIAAGVLPARRAAKLDPVESLRAD